MNTILIEGINIGLSELGKIILQNISFNVKENEAYAIVGNSGSGKTSLAKVLGGQLSISSGKLIFNLPSSYKRLFISQQHDFRDFSSRAYYQQRFDSNYGDTSPIVKEVLKSVSSDLTELQEVSRLLKIEAILNSRLIELSNGEGKRLQLAKAILQKPEILILDNPFIGLDAHARTLLHEVINQLIVRGIIIFIVTSPDEIPSCITHVLEMEEGSIKNQYSRADFISTYSSPVNKKISFVEKDMEDLMFSHSEKFNIAVRMKGVTVRYGDKKILEGIDWTIERGERWGLLGPNGAGKSTLLSLINGDNPQAYSNEIYLFDQKRGSGESIWDIKNKIGYISPEMHLFFQRNPSYTEAVALTSGINDVKGYSQSGTTCFEAVASGFNDQIGSSQRITSFQTKQVNQWMKFLNIEPLKNIALYKTSLGEQRIVLLARALVKNPPLLILDEPCQGLDKEQTLRFIELVDVVCDYFQKTLIYVSHYKEDIPKGITNFLVLEKGKIKEVKKSCIN